MLDNVVLVFCARNAILQYIFFSIYMEWIRSSIFFMNANIEREKKTILHTKLKTEIRKMHPNHKR